jgi:hypothetical protein
MQIGKAGEMYWRGEWAHDEAYRRYLKAADADGCEGYWMCRWWWWLVDSLYAR